jgi:hypothetical protein
MNHVDELEQEQQTEQRRVVRRTTTIEESYEACVPTPTSAPVAPVAPTTGLQAVDAVETQPGAGSPCGCVTRRTVDEYDDSVE